MLEKQEVAKAILKLKNNLQDASDSLLQDKHLISVGKKVILVLEEKSSILQEYYQQQEILSKQYQKELELVKKVSSRNLHEPLSPYVSLKEDNRKFTSLFSALLRGNGYKQPINVSFF